MAEGIELWRYDCGQRYSDDGESPCWHYLDRDPGSKVPGKVEKLLAFPEDEAEMMVDATKRMQRALAASHGMGRNPS